MTDTFEYSAFEGTFTGSNLPKPAWRVTLHGHGTGYSTRIEVPEGSQPIWIHRFFQKVILGFVWERI